MKLSQGQVAVLRTDTLYGLVAHASDQAAVEKVYALKGRDFNKPCIVLAADAEAIGKYGSLVAEVTQEYQGQPVTVIVPKTQEPEWITRGGSSVAYRIPQENNLQQLLKETGPLVAPSANPQGLPPARTIQDAKVYFGDQVDCYVDGGEVPVDTVPSQIIRLDERGKRERIR